MDTPIEEVPNPIIRNPHETIAFNTLYDDRLIKCEAQRLPSDNEDYAVKALIGNRWYRAELYSCGGSSGLWVIGQQKIACWDTAPHFAGLLKYDISPQVLSKVTKLPIAELFELFIDRCCHQYAWMETIQSKRDKSNPPLPQVTEVIRFTKGPSDPW